MASSTYRNEALVVAQPRTNWGAIWAGLFAFVAIWSVFGMLGEAIFASSASANAAHPVTGMSVGMAVWAVILTIIAMYVGGRVAGDLAGVSSRGEGAIYGTTVFGLAVIATILVVVIGGTALTGDTGVAGGPHSPYMLTVFSDVGWAGFAALLLGWLGAIGGAAHAMKSATRTTGNVRDIRPAA
jgi:hypothetical protein